MRIRKTQQVECVDCKSQYEKRADTLYSWNGLCRACTNKINKKGKTYSPLKKCKCGIVCSRGYSKCRDCGALRLEEHYKWITDRSKVKVSDRIINDPRRKEWTRAVKNRDGWKCKISNGNCSGKLEAHHILPWSKFPSLRYETKNGITLCHFHHPKKRDDEIKLSPYFQQLVASVG